MDDLFSDLDIATGDFVPGPATSIMPPPDMPNGGPTMDGPPMAPGGATVTSDAPRCEVCDVEIEWSGRGRRPKKCIDHRTRTRGPARVRIEAASEQADQKRLQWITDELTKGAGELAGAIVHAAPVTAVTIGHQSPDAVRALVRVGESYPKFLDGLEAIAKVSPFATIGKFACALLLAISIDLGRMKPYGIAAEVLGVAHAAQEAGWIDPDEQAAQHQQQVSTRNRHVPPPPQFQGL